MPKWMYKRPMKKKKMERKPAMSNMGMPKKKMRKSEGWGKDLSKDELGKEIESFKKGLERVSVEQEQDKARLLKESDNDVRVDRMNDRAYWIKQRKSFIKKLEKKK